VAFTQQGRSLIRLSFANTQANFEGTIEVTRQRSSLISSLTGP